MQPTWFEEWREAKVNCQEIQYYPERHITDKCIKKVPVPDSLLFDLWHL